MTIVDFLSRKVLLFVLFFVPVFAHAGQPVDTLEVGALTTTHILFMSDLSYVDVSTPDCIAVKVVEASKNMLAMKARKEFDFVTTISALETNGTMHTFYVRFCQNPSSLVVDTRVKDGGVVRNSQLPSPGGVVTNDSSSSKRAGKKRGVHTGSISSSVESGLNVTSSQASNFGRNDAPDLRDVTSRSQKLFHIGDSNFGISVYCTNVFVYSNLTYIVLRVENKTNIGFEAGDAQFNIESMRKRRKALVTDRSVWTKSSYGSLSCAPMQTSVVGYTIPKLTLLRGECLRIYIYEKSGNRNLVLTLSDIDVNYASSQKGRRIRI